MNTKKKSGLVSRVAIRMVLDTILAVLEPLKKFRDDLKAGKFDE